MARIIALYLPQFHPIDENNQWWGPGFTEWTNVGKAKPLFKGHYQPRVPRDLGYYDLRLPETRDAQAAMAKSYGIEAFCYWHYWFGNKRRLIERPFNEVLESGKPDFPFCLGWANHSWKDKQFSKDGTDTMLIEQLYGGLKDYTEHFEAVIPAFKDKRYVRVNDKPFFMIHSPYLIPDLKFFIETWQRLAIENGLKGIHFVANTHLDSEVEPLIKMGFGAVSVVKLFDVFKNEFNVLQRAVAKVKRQYLSLGKILDYEKSSKYFHSQEDKDLKRYPNLFPNWDHSPRSGRKGHILHNSHPKAFKKHALAVLNLVKTKPQEENIIILRSWNEWAEGNYIEPDLKFGIGYLQALQEAIIESK